MSNTQTIVTRALRRLQAIDINEQPSESEMTHAISVLSEMVNGWSSRGIPTDTQTLVGDITNGDDVVKNVDDVTTVVIGLAISGTGIPANAAVKAVLTPTSFQMNADATANGAGTSLTLQFLPMPAKYEGACVALLAVRLSEDLGLPVSAKLELDARDGWNAILAGYMPDRRVVFDRALARPAGTSPIVDELF